MNNQSISQESLIQKLVDIQSQLNLRLIEFKPSLIKFDIKTNSSEILQDRFDHLAEVFGGLPDGIKVDSHLLKLRSEFEELERKSSSTLYALSDLQTKIATTKKDLLQLHTESKSESLYTKDVYYQVEINKRKDDEVFNVYGRFVPGGFGRVTYRQLENRINQKLRSEKASKLKNPEDAIKYAQKKVMLHYFDTSVDIKTAELGLGVVAAGTAAGSVLGAGIGAAAGGGVGIGAAVALFGISFFAKRPMKDKIENFVDASTLTLNLIEEPIDNQFGQFLPKDTARQSIDSQSSEYSVSAENKPKDFGPSDSVSIDSRSPTSIYSETSSPLDNVDSRSTERCDPAPLREPMSRHGTSKRSGLRVRWEQQSEGVTEVSSMSGANQKGDEYDKDVADSNFYKETGGVQRSVSRSTSRSSFDKVPKTNEPTLNEQDNFKKNTTNSIHKYPQNLIEIKLSKGSIIRLLNPKKETDFKERHKRFLTLIIAEGAIPPKELFNAYTEFWELEHESKFKAEEMLNRPE